MRNRVEIDTRTHVGRWGVHQSAFALFENASREWILSRFHERPESNITIEIIEESEHMTQTPPAPDAMPELKPAYKQVLSGLSENSHGNGSFKRTVWHYYAVSDFHSGRIVRKKGQFLCSPKSSPFDVGFPHSGIPEVNCKSCIKIMERINAR